MDSNVSSTDAVIPVDPLVIRWYVRSTTRAKKMPYIVEALQPSRLGCSIIYRYYSQVVKVNAVPPIDLINVTTFLLSLFVSFCCCGLQPKTCWTKFIFVVVVCGDEDIFLRLVSFPSSQSRCSFAARGSIVDCAGDNVTSLLIGAVADGIRHSVLF